MRVAWLVAFGSMLLASHARAAALVASAAALPAPDVVAEAADPFARVDWFAAPVRVEASTSSPESGSPLALAASVSPMTLASPVTLAASTVTGSPSSKPRKPKHERQRLTSTDAGSGVLDAQRARTLLRSLTVPGWGQATSGHPRAAMTFAIAEAGAWGAFTSFRIQQGLRAQTFRRTARLAAGIELDGRDEEYLRIVGSFISSEEYNQLVVTRDAANLFLADPDRPDLAGYREYIVRHSLSGRNAWEWNDIEDLLRYRAQRRDSQRAAKRANSALAVAVANRILSALHAARIAGSPRPAGTSWRFDVTPDASDPTSWRAGLRARF